MNLSSSVYKNDISAAVVWWFGILENLGYEVVYSPYEEYNIEQLIIDIKNYKPDFVIHPTYDKIHTELIRLKEFTKLYILQSDDRWRYNDYSKYWISIVDGIITYEGNKSDYISDGLKSTQFNKMRWSFNPNMMTLGNDYHINRYFITHTGGLHGDRNYHINEFRKKNFNVDVFPNSSYEQTKHIWSSSKYSLCFTMNSKMTTKELKGRVVEIPNFCVMLTQSFPDMEQYIDTENDCVLFETVDEAIEKIKLLENDNNLYYTMFNNGKRKTWEENNCYIEWQKILPNIDCDFKPFDINKILKEKHGYKYDKNIF